MPDRTVYPFRWLGLEFQMPLLAAYALSAVLVAGAGLLIYQKVWADPERALVSVKDVNTQLAEMVEEYSKHAMETPEKHELFEDTDGLLALRVYKDHCVMIQRQTRLGGMRTKLVIDLARTGHAPLSQIAPPVSSAFVAYAQGPCQRGCLNPHPGNFKWWYGERKGDWIEVVRLWPDGCQHTQMFHPGSGTWDTNPDGSPKIHWICCSH